MSEVLELKKVLKMLISASIRDTEIIFYHFYLAKSSTFFWSKCIVSLNDHIDVKIYQEVFETSHKISPRTNFAV